MFATLTLPRSGMDASTGCELPWLYTAEPLGERHYQNWIKKKTFSCQEHIVKFVRYNIRDSIKYRKVSTKHPQHLKIHFHD